MHNEECIQMYAGGNPCTLTATASLDKHGNDRLELLLECGSTSCSPPRFQCDDIHDGLSIGKLTMICTLMSYKTVMDHIYYYCSTHIILL